jgi:glycerol-1-phosphate dehydrogenase [NAD(P)+]
VEWLTITEGEGKLIHTTPENSEKIEARLGGVSCVVGVGSGTLCDLCKRATFHINEEHPLPLVIVQTALSVNAFSDGVSVMLINGVKRTIHSHYPSILIVDLDIIADAPAEMNVSGYGDLIATWTAPVDWYLANVLGMGDNFHTAPSDMIRTVRGAARKFPQAQGGRPQGDRRPCQRADPQRPVHGHSGRILPGLRF